MLVLLLKFLQNETMQTTFLVVRRLNKHKSCSLKVCGEQLNSNGQNFIKVLAENERLLVLPQVLEQFGELKAEYDKEVTVDVNFSS